MAFKPVTTTARVNTMKLSSPAFGYDKFIPSEYTCDGSNVSPPLLIGYIPIKTKSLVLIVEDPDAPMGVWLHWLMWNISPQTKKIRKNSVPRGAIQGINSFKRHNYGGPCPPSGTHRYFFKLYALNTILDISVDSTKAELKKAMKSHIISQAELIGLYKRK